MTRVLVTGSAGHLGEALMRLLPEAGHEAVGFDLQDSPHTTHVGSIGDPAAVARAMEGCGAVLHTATLHKPHVATHARQDFVDTNVTGTLTLLEEAARQGVGAFVFTSTTSTFGAALTPPEGAPAAWIDEDVTPVPKNIYGVTKTAAEDLCRLAHRLHSLPVVILRTARFFPEPDDDPERRQTYDDANSKANEFLFRRVDLEDVATAHLAALERAAAIGCGRYIVSATTPFGRDDLAALAADASAVVARREPRMPAIYEALGWRMFPTLDRVYDNARARRDLGWAPRYDFAAVLAQAEAGQPICSALARNVGIKGYHGERYGDGLYPIG